MLVQPKEASIPSKRADRTMRTLRRLDLADAFFVLGIFLLPYDAFPVMPSTYRPISIFPFAISLLFVISDVPGREIRIIDKRQLLVLAFFAMTICINAFRALCGDIQVDGFIDTALTLAIGVVVYFCISGYLKRRASREPLETTLNWLLHQLSAAYVIPLAIGCAEALSLGGLLPASVNSTLSGFFGGNQSSRLTLTSFEASWASIHLLIAALSNLFLYRRDKGVFHLGCFCIASLLFLYTNSMQGIMILACASVVFIFWYGYISGRILIILKWILLAALIFASILVAMRLYFVVSESNAYYATRLIYFTDIDHLIHTDGSSFVRLVFPIIGIQMLIANPAFGVGAGAFAQQLPFFIAEYYPWSLKFEEVAQYLSGSLVPSATCLYTRVLGECGVFGSIPFFAFLGSSLRCIGVVANRGGMHGVHMVYLVLVLICTQLQFASYAYLPFWLALALLDSAHYSSIPDEGSCL